MKDDTDITLLLELAAERPMDRNAVLSRMRSEFTKEELRHIVVGAGAALVVHGAKPSAADIDCTVTALPELERMAERRAVQLTKSEVNGQPRLEVGGFAELFFDPIAEKEAFAHVKVRDVEVDGVRVDSPEACVAWYEYMVRKVGRPKDRENLRLAKTLIPRYEVRGSHISGRGAFSIESVRKGESLGLAMTRHGRTGNADRDITRTELGALVNHSGKPNLELRITGSEYEFIAARDIAPGEELTVDYRSFDFEGKRDFASRPKYYDPPMKLEDIRKKHPHLADDPVHNWRATSGIELIHKEPTVEELDRIWANWQLMPSRLKRISDKKSRELFGLSNEENYQKLRKTYDAG
jgi:hypothetical protein